MTDDNVRPEPNPSRESRPGGLEEGVGDAAAQVDETEASGESAAADGEATVDPEVPVELEDDPAVAADENDQVDDVDDVVAADKNDRVDDVDDVVAAESANGQETVDEPTETEPEIVPVAESDESKPDESETPEVGTPGAEEARTETVETEVVAAGDETETMPGVDAKPGDQRSDAFVWHPEHRGKTFDEVRAGLAQDIAADQRQHRLAMDGAEESEQEALASVVGLERKWGKFDFDWAEQEPDALADRIVDFERERERRRSMISWSDYRDGGIELDEALVAGERPAELSSSAKGLSLLLVVLLIVVILLAVWAL